MLLVSVVWAGGGTHRYALDQPGDFRAKVVTPLSRGQALGRRILGRVIRRGCTVVFLLASIAER